MKTIKILLGLAVLMMFGLISCDKTQEPLVQPQDPIKVPETPTKPTPAIEKEKEKKPEKPLMADLIALKSLGLKTLEIDSTSLPPLPIPDDPNDNLGLDTIYNRWEAKWKRPSANQDPNKFLTGGDEGWRMTSEYIIWGYGRPSGILLGKRTKLFDMGSDQPEETRKWYDKPYIPLTLKYDRKDIVKYFSINGAIELYRFDSLTRRHGVVKGNWALHENTPMPYDLRHMRIAHEGVDISPLFSIRYRDYKEVIRTRKYNKWYWRDVRVSDVGMDVLDWIFDGYFEIYPLTKDYPKFTIIFILKDGTVISREVEHRL